MRKGIVLLAVLVLGLLTSLFVAVDTVKAAGISMSIKQGFTQTTFVNQPVEITAIPTSGTPPYTYQWYTQLWTTWKPGLSYFLPPLGPIVAFPGATSATFEFVESTPGTYDISLNISDSAGNGDYDSFPISGVWVIVQALPAPSPTPLPSPPSISFLSLENKTYQTNNTPLNFTLSKPAQWISYSIDGKSNITVDGNTTLTGLSNGSHTLTIYANDTYGNTGKSETVNFAVAEPIQPEAFPTTLVIASIVSVAVVGVGLLVYFKKRKH